MSQPPGGKQFPPPVGFLGSSPQKSSAGSSPGSSNEAVDGDGDSVKNTHEIQSNATDKDSKDDDNVLDYTNDRHGFVGNYIGEEGGLKDNSEQVQANIILYQHFVLTDINGDSVTFYDLVMDSKVNFGSKATKSKGSNTKVCVAKVNYCKDEKKSLYNIVSGDTCDKYSWAVVDVECRKRAEYLTKVLSLSNIMEYYDLNQENKIDANHDNQVSNDELDQDVREEAHQVNAEGVNVDVSNDGIREEAVDQANNAQGGNTDVSNDGIREAVDQGNNAQEGNADAAKANNGQEVVLVDNDKGENDEVGNVGDRDVGDGNNVDIDEVQECGRQVPWFLELLLMLKALNRYMFNQCKVGRNNIIIFVMEKIKERYGENTDEFDSDFKDLEEIKRRENYFLTVSYIVQRFTRIIVRAVNWGNFLYHIQKFYNIQLPFENSKILKISKFPKEEDKPVQVEDLKHHFYYYLIVDDSEKVIQDILKSCLEYKVSSDVSKELHDL